MLRLIMNDHEHLYHQLGEELLAFIRSRLDHPDDADDVFQEMWVKLLAKPPGDGNTRAWLYRVVRNLITDHQRRRPRDVVMPPLTTVSETEAQVATWLRPMIASLPEKYAQPLIMADLERMSMKDIAASLDLTLAATKSRVQRARKMLNKDLFDCCSFWFDKNGRMEGWQRNPPKCGCDNEDPSNT